MPFGKPAGPSRPSFHLLPPRRARLPHPRDCVGDVLGAMQHAPQARTTVHNESGSRYACTCVGIGFVGPTGGDNRARKKRMPSQIFAARCPGCRRRRRSPARRSSQANNLTARSSFLVSESARRNERKCGTEPGRFLRHSTRRSDRMLCIVHPSYRFLGYTPRGCRGFVAMDGKPPPRALVLPPRGHNLPLGSENPQGSTLRRVDWQHAFLPSLHCTARHPE